MANLFRGVGTLAGALGTSAAPGIPTSAKPGDFMILEVATNGTTTHSTPAGWTLIRSDTSGVMRQSIYWRFFVTGDAAPTINFGDSVDYAAGIVSYSGVDNITPIETHDASTGSSTTPSAPSVQVPLNCIGLWIGCNNNTSTPVPSGHVARIQAGNNIRGSICEEDYLAKATGGVTGTILSSPWVAAHVILRPAQTPVFRSSTEAAGIASGTNVNTPSSQQIGDMKVAVVRISTAGSVITTPSGWTKRINEVTFDTTKTFAVFTKLATAAGAESVTWTFTGGGSMSVGFALFSGVGSIDIIGSTTEGASPVVASAIITTDTNDLLLAIGASSAGATSTSTGMVLHTSGASLIHVLSESNQANGNTGTRSITSSGNAIEVLLALKSPTNQPKLRSVRPSQASGATSATVNVPPNVINGDKLVLMIEWAAVISALTPPAGWTEIESDMVNHPLFKAYERIASSEPANYAFSWTTSASWHAIMVCLKGGGVIDLDGRTRTAASTIINFPSITTTGTPRLLLFFSGTAVGNAITSPIGSVEVSETAVSINASLAYEVQSTAAATGARTATCGSSDNQGYVIAIIGNQPPTTPTNLTRTSETTDTTPAFSADISDPDTTQDIKARFQIYQSDGVTPVGSVDSSFRTGAGTVTAEYSSALPTGTYKVQAATVDSQGAISAYTAQVTFTVTTIVSKDLNLLWDVDVLINKDLSLVWNVLVSNQKDLSLLWNVKINTTPKELVLLWDVHPEWENVPYETSTPVWQEVAP